jgi:predicted MFS family arabinose efflux permease
MAWAIGSDLPLWAVMGLHLLASVTAHGFEPASRSWIADHVAPPERPRAYGLMRVAVNVGFAAGPALGGFLAQRSYALVFALSAVVCAACAAASTRLTDRPLPRRAEPFDPAGALKAAGDKRFRGLCFNNCLISVAMAQLVVSVSIYATSFLRMPESRVGLLFTINGLMVAVLQFPATGLLSRLPLTGAITAGCLLYAAGFASVGWAAGFSGMAAAMALITLGEIFVAPGVNALAANLAPRRERGRYMGFFGLTHQAGASLGPLTGGLGLDLLSARWAPAHWLGVAAVALAAAAGFHSLRKGLTDSEQGLNEAPFEVEDPVESPFGA